MFRTLQRSFAVATLAVALFAPAIALAADEVAVALTARRVVNVQGRETLVDATQAKPGETIEYRAIYTNTSKTPVKQLQATLPIPGGLELLPTSPAPAVFTGSIDGRTFAALPLKRSERTPDGRVVVREVPASEIRYLRWSLGTLAPRGAKTVVARARVAPPAVAVAR